MSKKIENSASNNSNEKIESELLFLFKFVLYLIITMITLPLSIFFPKLRENLKKPFEEVKNFIFGAKITFILVIINIIIFFLEIFLIKSNTINTISLLNLKITGIHLLDVFINIIFTGFLHASWSHLLGNMLMLFVFGRIVEKYIPEKYLLIYFGSMIFGGGLSSLLGQPGIGASAAIAGIVLTAILIRPFYFSFAAIIPVPVFILGWISIYGDFAAALARNNDGIGHLAHIGGYVSAFLVSLFFVGTNKKHKIKQGLIVNMIMLLITFAVWFLFFRH